MRGAHLFTCWRQEPRQKTWKKAIIMAGFICSIALVMFVSLAGLPMQVFAEQTSVKLFDATPTFSTGPVRSPAEAIPFVGTSLILDFAPGDTAVISSTPDGIGPIVIDNFLTINGENVCVGVAGQDVPESCFGPRINPTPQTGDPIEAVLTPIPPIDVSNFIPPGKTTVQFDLRDFGDIAGNTDLFLVTTATVVPIRPATAETAFDKGMDLFAGQLRPAIVEAFQKAFKEQVSTPVLSGLQKANAAPETIAKVESQLAQASAKWASIAATAFASLLDGRTLLSQPQRKFGGLFQEPATPPTSIEKFVANVGVPTIKLHQSIPNILAFGFNSDRVKFMWKQIAAEITFSGPNPVFATATGSVTAKMGLDGKPCVEAGAKVGGSSLSAGVNGNMCQGGKAEINVTVEVQNDVPDLSLAGFVALLAAIIALGVLRHKPAASRAA